MRIDFNPPVEATPVEATTADVEAVRMELKPDVPPEEVFPQSVSSGDPSPRGAILWTRIHPDAYEEDVPLIVEIARDEKFESDLQQRLVDSSVLTPDHDYTVKVNLDESELDLEADSWYYYQFEYDGVRSQTGRCKTLPNNDATPESVRFALVTCQDYQNGYYPAYHYVAQEAVDYLIDLGDFRYEVNNGKFTRDGRPDSYPGHEIGAFPSEIESGQETGIAHDLRDYRHLYQTYHSDQFLQRALEQHTRIFCWDDHEFANNIYWDRQTGSPRAPGHPYDGDPDRMKRLVRDALQAWWEYTPTRVEYKPQTREIKDVITLYRTFQFGDLVKLIVTDERLHRDQPQPQPARVKNLLRNELEDHLPTGIAGSSSENDLDQTMLGKRQREWFINEIHNSESLWTVWCNEVLTLPIKIPLPKIFHDAWDGFDEERELIMREINSSQMLVSLGKRSHGVRNFITLTGDMHSYLAGYQQTIYPEENAVGVELMTPALTSLNITEALIRGVGRRESRIGRITKTLAPAITKTVLSTFIPKAIRNVKFFNSRGWGYSVVTFTREHCTYRAYSVDKTKDSPDAPRKLVTELRVPRDRIEIKKIT